MRRFAFFAFFASSLAMAEDVAPGRWAGSDAPVLVEAPDAGMMGVGYEVQAVAKCDGVDGPVGSGCWMPEQDCIAVAKERASFRQALKEAELKPANGGPGLKSFVGVAVLGFALGFGVAWAVKK